MSHSRLEKEITAKPPLRGCTRTEKQGTANVANGREWIRLKLTPGQRPTSARGAEVFTGGAEGRFLALPSAPPVNGVIGQVAVAYSRARRAIRGHSRFPIFGLGVATWLSREFTQNPFSASDEQQWTVIKPKKSCSGTKGRKDQGKKPSADQERLTT